MQETWKDILGYEGYYQVSSFGRVKSIKCNREKILRYSLNGPKLDYCFIRLFMDGKYKNHKIHRLVANTFISNPLNKPQVNHIDGNKQNNHVENLEWCNNSENMIHASKNNLRVYKTKIILQYDLQGKYIKEYSSITEASKITGINLGNISNMCRGDIRYKSVGGYKWKFK